MKKIYLLFLLFFNLSLLADQTIEMNDFSGNEHGCSDGGVEIIIGDDTDPQSAYAVYVCNGENGCNMISTAQRRFDLVESCPTGDGVVITSGLDCDFDGNIDNVVESAAIVLCSGGNGKNGSDGVASAAGGNAANGKNGEDGKMSEFVISEEFGEENCKNGGIRIETRFDADGNGSFDESEITVNYVCNGSDSPQGTQGEPGKAENSGTDGSKIKEGEKGNSGDKGEQGDKGEAGEKGETGADGFDSLVSVVDEPAGDNCGNGGKKFMSGLDKDRNGILDESEVKNSYYICNGEDALEASEAAASSSGCSLTLF